MPSGVTTDSPGASPSCSASACASESATRIPASNPPTSNGARTLAARPCGAAPAPVAVRGLNSPSVPAPKRSSAAASGFMSSTHTACRWLPSTVSTAVSQPGSTVRRSATRWLRARPCACSQPVTTSSVCPRAACCNACSEAKRPRCSCNSPRTSSSCPVNCVMLARATSICARTVSARSCQPRLISSSSCTRSSSVSRSVSAAVVSSSAASCSSRSRRCCACASASSRWRMRDCCTSTSWRGFSEAELNSSHSSCHWCMASSASASASWALASAASASASAGITSSSSAPRRARRPSSSRR